jgi:hypothetical protein
VEDLSTSFRVPPPPFAPPLPLASTCLAYVEPTTLELGTWTSLGARELYVKLGMGGGGVVCGLWSWTGRVTVGMADGVDHAGFSFPGEKITFSPGAQTDTRGP